MSNKTQLTTRIGKHHFCPVRAILEVYFNVLTMLPERFVFLLCAAGLGISLAPSAGCCSLQPGHPRKEQEGSAEAGVRKVGMIWKAKEQECQCLAQFCSTASEAVPCSWTWAWGWDFKPASNFGEKLNGLKFSSSFSSSSSLLRIQS